MRYRLTYHDGAQTEVDAPNGIQVALDEISVRLGFDVRPCLQGQPEPVPEPALQPIESDQHEKGQPTQVPGDDGEVEQQHGAGGLDASPVSGGGSSPATGEAA